MDSPILVCFDRSGGARHAIERAGTLFPGRDAIVLTLWDFPLELPALGLAIDMIGGHEQQSSADATAAEGCAVARRAGLVPEPRAACGSLDGTWQTIIRIGRETDASVIVLGARGLHGLRALLGSVSREVSQHADRPVLIVPPGAERASVGYEASAVAPAHVLRQ